MKQAYDVMAAAADAGANLSPSQIIRAGSELQDGTVRLSILVLIGSDWGRCQALIRHIAALDLDRS